MFQLRDRRSRLLPALFVLCAASLSLAASKHDFEVVNNGSIYYGSGKHPKSPAVCCADDVWAEIPEYQTIVEEELTASDPRYHLLMKRATKRFQRALKALASREGYDMIGEVGSIKAVGDEKKEIPNATKDLIDLVTRS